MSDERRLGGKEMQQVLHRAAELQSNADQAPGDGLSLEALEDLARQSGLDPALVRQALDEMDRGELRKRHWFLGSVPKIELERSAPAELTELQLLGLVEEIEETLGTVGTTRRLGRDLIWTASQGILSRVQGLIRGLRRDFGSDLPTVVRVSPAKGRTSVSVVENLRGEASRTFLSWILGAGLPLGFLSLLLAAFSGLSPALVGAGWLASLVVAYFLARSHFASTSARRQEKIADLVGRLCAHARDSGLQEDADHEEAGSLPSTAEQEELGLERGGPARAPEGGSAGKGSGSRRRTRS